MGLQGVKHEVRLTRDAVVCRECIVRDVKNSWIHDNSSDDWLG